MKYYFRCPSCGNDTDFVKPTEQDNNAGCLMLFFSGILPFLLLCSASSARIQCGRCKTLFAQPGLPSNKAARQIGLLVGIIICVLFASVFFFAIPSLARLLPVVPVFSVLEDAILNQPRVALYLLLVVSFLAVFPLWIAAAMITRKSHKKTKAHYCYNVPFAPDPRLPGADTEFKDDKQNTA